LKSLKVLKAPKEVKAPRTDAEITEELLLKIDSSLNERNKPEFKKVGGFHPSYTNQCARYWYYLFEGVVLETSFSAQTHRIFDNGHAVHDRLYKYFNNIGILVAEEIPVSYSNPSIEGTADGIIDWYGHKLIELKSISSEGFHYRQLYNKPKDEHYRQAQIYMKCLNLNSGYVIYENKNNQEILPIFIEKDDDFIDKLFKKYNKIYQDFVDGNKPKHPYKRTSANCQNCDLAKMCWSEDAPGVEDPF